jgi:hypothetical protein
VEVPFAFVAVTVNVYEVPWVSPLTVIGDVPVPVNAPGEDVAVYVAAAPPVAPAVYVTNAEVVEALDAVPIVGA